LQARRTLLQMYYLDVMIFSYPLSVTFTVVYIFTFECDDMFTEFYFIPFPDASVCKINFFEKSGLRKTGSLQIQSFNLSNAFCVVSDHLTLFVFIESSYHSFQTYQYL
jgi:hypothetical protein